MRLLLIEDEEALAEVIRRGLMAAHYHVDVATDGVTGLEMALGQNYTLVLLDIMLPQLDGWQICTRLRAHRNKTPILMLTARDALQDRVHGLDLGADDYLLKPFEFPELLARVRALIRRDKIHRTRIIRIADLVIDTGERRVFRGGQETYLTEREYDLLEALGAYEGRPLTRYRSRWRRSRAQGGTGLGLAICQGIVQAHSGSLDITSAPNVGTTIRVTLLHTSQFNPVFET